MGGSTLSWLVLVAGSRNVPSPIDDCESFAGRLKKSSAARSGEVEDEDSEGAPPETRRGGRERNILMESICYAMLTFWATQMGSPPVGIAALHPITTN